MVFPQKCIEGYSLFMCKRCLILSCPWPSYVDLFKVTLYFLPLDSSPPNHHLRLFLGTFSKHQTCKFQNSTSTKYGKLYKDWKITKITQLKTNIIWTKPPWLWLLSNAGYAKKTPPFFAPRNFLSEERMLAGFNPFSGGASRTLWGDGLLLVYNMRPWAPF